MAERLTYQPVGGTEFMFSGAQAPSGFDSVLRSQVIGRGEKLYRRVAEGVLNWKIQRLSGLQVAADGAAEPGVLITSYAGVGPLRLRVPCQVVWAQHDQADSAGGRRTGFGYGTLPGHPELGEEGFVVEISAGGEVSFSVAIYSLPAWWPLKLAPFAARWAQKFATSGYFRAATKLAAG